MRKPSSIDNRNPREFEVISRGRVIAHIATEDSRRQSALDRLLVARAHCTVGDIVSPSNEPWDAES